MRRRQWHPTPVLLPENPMDRGVWWAAVHGVAKSRTLLSDFTFTFHFHALEKEMASHPSVLAWRIPGTREPGGLTLWGHTESDTTEAPQQQQQHAYLLVMITLSSQVYDINHIPGMHCTHKQTHASISRNFVVPFFQICPFLL